MRVAACWFPSLVFGIRCFKVLLVLVLVLVLLLLLLDVVPAVPLDMLVLLGVTRK